MSGVVAFLAGLVFAVGLGLAGMTHPTKVLGFLDVTGHWDPTLAFVMGSAVAVTALGFPRVLARARPVLADRFALPTGTRVDRRLVFGAAVFGVGWGLTGLCPGPAVVCLVTGTPAIGLFVIAMLVGLALAQGRLSGHRFSGPRDGDLARSAERQPPV